MPSASGISYLNHADACTITGPTKLSGTGTVTALTPVANLKTRQLSEAHRVSITGRGSVVSFYWDGVLPSNGAYKNTPTFLPTCFGLFGIKPIQANSGSGVTGGTGQPWYALFDVTIRFQAWTGTTPGSGTLVLDTTATALDYIVQGAMFGTPTIPATLADDLPCDFFLRDIPRVASGSPGCFRVTVSTTNFTGGSWIVDFGRLWVGDSWVPSFGVSDVQEYVNDGGTVTESRDNQGYPQYFSKATRISMKVPALSDIELRGWGTQTDGSLGGPVWPYLRAVQYYLGTTRECVVWTALGLMDYVVYGRITSWDPIAVLQARGRKKNSSVSIPANSDRMYTTGWTVVQER